MPALIRNLIGTGMPVQLASVLQGDIADNQTATGTTQATALVTGKAVIRCTTVASGTGVRLNSGIRGDSQVVINDGASTLSVYPPVGHTITGFSANAAFSVTAGAWAYFERVTDSKWIVDNDSDNMMFTPSGSGAVTRTVQAKIRDSVPLTPEDFGAVGDGTTDDKTALSNWITALLANTNCSGKMLSKNYATSGALTSINVSGVKIIGFGPSSNHDTGAINGTVIKAITNSGFTMLTVAPTEGASSQRLDGVQIKGVSFDCAQLAAKGLVIKSIRNSEFDVYGEEATTTVYDLGVVTTLGDAKDLQDCVFRLFGRCVFTSGNVLQLNGTSSANVSLNWFEFVDVVHKDATAIVTQNPDNNQWGSVRVFRTAGGSATNSIEWQGGATTAQSTRDEIYEKLTTTVAAIAKGTGTYTVPAHNIMIRWLDLGNGTPVPTVETGASVTGAWIDWTSTITASAGTITTSSSTASYKIEPLDPLIVSYRIAITITTNGTGSGSLLATLPFTTANDGLPHVAFGYEAATGRGVRAAANVASNSLGSVFSSDANYPGADGRVVVIQGWFKRA